MGFFCFFTVNQQIHQPIFSAQHYISKWQQNLIYFLIKKNQPFSFRRLCCQVRGSKVRVFLFLWPLFFLLPLAAMHESWGAKPEIFTAPLASCQDQPPLLIPPHQNINLQYLALNIKVICTFSNSFQIQCPPPPPLHWWRQPTREAMRRVLTYYHLISLPLSPHSPLSKSSGIFWCIRCVRNN